MWLSVYRSHFKSRLFWGGQGSHLVQGLEAPANHASVVRFQAWSREGSRPDPWSRTGRWDAQGFCLLSVMDDDRVRLTGHTLDCPDVEALRVVEDKACQSALQDRNHPSYFGCPRIPFQARAKMGSDLIRDEIAYKYACAWADTSHHATNYPKPQADHDRGNLEFA